MARFWTGVGIEIDIRTEKSRSIAHSLYHNARNSYPDGNASFVQTADSEPIETVTVRFFDNESYENIETQTVAFPHGYDSAIIANRYLFTVDETHLVILDRLDPSERQHIVDTKQHAPGKAISKTHQFLVLDKTSDVTSSGRQSTVQLFHIAEDGTPSIAAPDPMGLKSNC